MNQTTTNLNQPNTPYDDVEIPIEFRNYVTFVKRQREEDDFHTSWQEGETPPSTPSSEEDTTSPVNENKEIIEQEESSTIPEPDKDNGKNKSEGSSSDLILGPVNPSMWQSLHHHQNDEYNQLDWAGERLNPTTPHLEPNHTVPDSVNTVTNPGDPKPVGPSFSPVMNAAPASKITLF